ncbi:1144_t:CDS:2, partial [Racocetra persica]
MPPSLYNKYEVSRSEEYLGKGAHGIVMKGLDLLNNKDVACKFMFRESMESMPQEFYNRISEEATIISKIKHPNIVEFLDSWKGPEHTIVILEFLKGGSLLAFINNEREIKFDVWVGLAYQICDAIQFMHDSGYMHRDIKAANIMFEDKSYKLVKLIDFGLTKAF